MRRKQHFYWPIHHENLRQCKEQLPDSHAQKIENGKNEDTRFWNDSEKILQCINQIFLEGKQAQVQYINTGTSTGHKNHIIKNKHITETVKKWLLIEDLIQYTSL